MTRALIGHTGFVGGVLNNQMDFDARFNSGNIEDLRGQYFDEIYCAGVQAVKWWANKEPEKDWERIQRLLDPLSEVGVGRFVLLSTVDVFQETLGLDENSDVDRDGLHPYGLHRLRVEDFVRENFEKHHIVRLPGLFGKGLKKNIIYDFLMDNQTEKIDSRCVFQFYNLNHLCEDLLKTQSENISLLHVATGPLSVAEVAAGAFGKEFDNTPLDKAPFYDFRSVHANAWGRDDGYLYSKEVVLEEIRVFASRARAEGLLGGDL
jgi:nucleoside-diphosphate-sugar epimerase